MKSRVRLWAVMALVAVVAVGLAIVREAKERIPSVDIQGLVKSPSRIPLNGRETVLDILNASGGLLTSPSVARISVIRRAAGRTPGFQVLPVDLSKIILKGDTTTNYVLLPGDRLIVR